MSDTWDSAPIATAPKTTAPAAWDSAPVVESNARQNAVAFSNDNAEEAAKAVQLGKKMQLPATVVQSDLPGYDATARSSAASKAVANPALAKYIDGNPMAAKVSSDDWDSMEEASATLRALHPDLVKEKAQGGVFAGIVEVNQLMQDAPGRDKLFTALKQLPEAFLTAMNTGIMEMLKTPGKVASGEINLTTPEGLDQGISFGVGVALGTRDLRFGRTGDAVKAPKGQSTPADVDSFLGTLKGMASRAEIDAFLKSKKQGPPGATLLIEHAREGSEALSKAVEVAQTSKTKQRSPELFAEAAQAHEPGSVHIDAGKMLELYKAEGKVPAEGDGLFGFVPDLAGKIQDAAATGGEVAIPIAQYIAHIDPSVHEGLRDNVRLHEDGVTPAESVEAQKQIEAWHGTPHDFESFDLTKIGTGEGNQSFGHGLYFAENKATAEQYQQNLGGVGGKVQYSNGAYHIITDNGETIGPFETQAEAKAATEPGKIYKVSINADPQKFLDWDTKIAEQSSHVQETLKSVLGDKFDPEMKGQTAYEAAAIIEDKYPKNKPEGHPISSKRLAEAGIPGLKYLDAGSRVAGDGTHNYVIFDDKLVKITEKNGNAVEAAVIEATEAETKRMKLSPNLTMYMENGKALGITETELAQYSKKIERQEQAVLDAAVRMKEAAIRKPLTAEWKRNEASIRGEVMQEFDSTGPFAAEEFLRKNKIDISTASGDDLAPMFGFETGIEMKNALLDLETARADSGKGPKWFRAQAEKAEIAARMEERYGDLKENIAKEARQLALDTHQFDILADEVSLLAKAAGVVPPLNRAELTAWAKGSFERSLLPEASNWTKLSRAVERGGRETEKALLKGDFQEAFQAKQRQTLAAHLAKESLALQKVLDGVEKKIDRFLSDQVIKGLDQVYLEQIRQVLASVGLPQQFRPAGDLVSLRDFVDASDGQLAVASWLMDGSQPQMQGMSVGQFREFAESLTSLEHVGKQVGTVMSARGPAELQNVVFDAKRNLERFPFIDQPMNPSVLQTVRSLGRRFVGAHLLVEKMFDYTDRSDPHGPLTTYIDRPLRDAHSKYLEMTEKVSKSLRDLYPYTENAGLSELIPNKLIPDALSKTGFMQMNRRNLRELMLNTGNWSNLKKASEGFGVNEADLRRFIDENATAKDVAWVNGVWQIFKDLKPEADAVHLRDTGVPVDTVEAVNWDVKAGKLEGGYYPITYDRMNSNIEGHLASKTSLFDKGYVQASTPKAYTQARTEFTGALDLQGMFLNSKLRGMVHDIAFREAVRSVNRVITNQEFRTSVAQYWGREAAELMPGWIKSIANSHNLDVDYAPQLVRGMAMVRQNVVATLISFNPSTYIKHGFTAAVMSANEVGLRALVKEMVALGPKGAGQVAKDLIARSDVVSDADYIEAFRETIMDEKRGEEIRQFVLQSSPMLRARSAKTDDSIAGAIRQMNREGMTGKFGELRDANILYGRFMVSFFDQMSTVPTWYAAYKKAYMGGELHDDAVFIADKAVSRAHGSSFTGDQPAVTRLPNTFLGELGRWFVPLYKFYNHFANMNFQLTWDAAAYLRGPKEGGAGEPPPPGVTPGPDGEWSYPQEPGANAARIAKYVGLVLAIVYVENLAKPALEEDKKGVLGQMLSQAAHLFGGQFIGLREISGPAMHGLTPSTGLLGTLGKAAYQTVGDIKKATSAQAAVSKDWIIHTATALGFATGLGGTQIGRTGSFVKDVITGRDRPKTFNEVRQGLRTGHSQPRKH